MKGIRLSFPWPKRTQPMDTIDFPLQLRGSLASEDLAQALHRAVFETYGMTALSWDELRQDERRHYRLVSAALLLEMKPKARLLGARFNRFAKRLKDELNGR